MNKQIHLIDCNVPPYIPEGLRVEKHMENEQLIWGPSKIRLYFLPGHQFSWWQECIEGNELYEKLEDQAVLNASVLDYLLINPQLIPKRWKDKDVFFWGTIYRCSCTNLCVRCLHWHTDHWEWRRRWLNALWHHRDPAIIRI